MQHLVIVAYLFATAWLLGRVSALVAGRVLLWNDRRHSAAGVDLSDKMAHIKRRETLVSVIRAGVAYVGFAAAAVLAVAELSGGVDRLTAIAGASFVLIVAGFAIQRVLVDIIAGLTMFVERWYSVGDSISIPTLELQGVVEEVTLRHTRLRALTGEVVHVHNSQIPAVRVLPAGVKDLAIDLFVSDAETGETVVRRVASLLPEGPTTFVKRPWLARTEELGDGLFRMTLRATVAHGSEWLAERFFSDLLKERAPDGLVVHGPVVLSDDAGTERSFARTSAATRWRRAA